jgi:predicted GTPase
MSQDRNHLNVHDTPGLGEKWSVDQNALVAKLQRLPKSTLIAIQEATDRFWSQAELSTVKGGGADRDRATDPM